MSERGFTPPIVSFVGRSGSGKTTLVERVIASLSIRGFRVGAVKHHAHDIELDVVRKDSWRHAQAGAVANVVSGPRQFALFQRVERERTLAELVELLGDVDVVLVEGYRADSASCVEVVRGANSPEMVCSADELIAIVTDLEPSQLPAAIGDAVATRRIELFTLDDAEAIASAIAVGSLTWKVPQ